MKISLYEAQQLYFNYALDTFKSKLVILGFEHINSHRVSSTDFVFIKGKITVQIRGKAPVEVRTWKNSSNLRIFDNFKKALFAVINEDF